MSRPLPFVRTPVSFFVWALIVVRFDGSLRPPTIKGDPRTATASATISTSAKNQDILYLGGCHLDTSETFRKSGQVEFAGLLLGLEGILAHKKALRPLAEERHVILIEGDCKTAIQQMQGRALSRKLGPLYERAKTLESQIPWKLQYEHCPRDKNTLCDRICYGLVHSRHEYFVDQFCCDCSDLLVSGPLRGSENSRRLSAAYLTPGKTYFKGLERLLMLSILARFAWLEGDYGHVQQCGIQMQDLTDSLRSVSTGQRQSRTNPLHYKVEGVLYEINALRRLGHIKEATKAERREKSLLRKHETSGTQKSAVNLEATTTATILKDELLEWKRKHCCHVGENSLDIQGLLLEQSGIEGEMMCHRPKSSGMKHAMEKLFSATSKCTAFGESHWVSVDDP